MRTWVVVPAKHFERAKSRLSPVLDSETRRALARKMLEHVLRVSSACSGVAGALVVTDSDDVGSVATGFGAVILRDRSAGSLAQHLDDALTELDQREADAALILMSDLPGLTLADLWALIRELRHSDVVLASDASGHQTNALGLWLRKRFPMHFGTVGSFHRHREAAARSGLKARSLTRPTLEFDVDDPDDYSKLTRRSFPRPV